MSAVSTDRPDRDSDTPAEAVAAFLNAPKGFHLPSGPVEVVHLVLTPFESEFADEAYAWRLTPDAPPVHDAAGTVFVGEPGTSSFREGTPEETARLERGVTIVVDGGFVSCADCGSGEGDEILAEYAFAGVV